MDEVFATDPRDEETDLSNDYKAFVRFFLHKGIYEWQW